MSNSKRRRIAEQGGGGKEPVARLGVVAPRGMTRFDAERSPRPLRSGPCAPHIGADVVGQRPLVPGLTLRGSQGIVTRTPSGHKSVFRFPNPTSDRTTMGLRPWDDQGGRVVVLYP